MGAYGQSHLLRRSADGATPSVDLNLPGLNGTSWSPDGKTLLLHSYRLSNSDLFTLSITGSARPESLLATPSNELEPTLSPDGRWVAYMSDESGRFEAYVRPFPDIDGGKWLISTDGGAFPRWTRGGREIVYRSGTKLMAVPVSAGASFVPGRPEVLWDRAYFARPSLRDFDVSPDGERFLFLRQEGGSALYLVQNWAEELKAKVGPVP
jgi:serine/threonine-protein kinase